MKRLRLLLTLLTFAAPLHATIWPNIFANSGINASCTTGTSACAIALPLKVGANDLLMGCIFVAAVDTGKTIASVTGDGGAFVDKPSAVNATFGDVNCGYILTAAGGETSLTLNTSASITNAWKAIVFDVPVSGATFDVTATVNTTGAATTQPGATTSPTSRGDMIVQCTKGGALTTWLANRGYQLIQGNGTAGCWFLSNTFNGTAPTFTFSATTQLAAVAIDFSLPLSPASVIF